MENKLSIISICIPAYKRVQYLSRLIDSIRNQNYLSFEVVITDDSGEDSEVEDFISSSEFKFPMRYFKNPIQLGSPKNWLSCVEKASGDWIKIMHDDDYFTSSDSLQNFANFIRNDIDCIFSGYKAVFDDGSSNDMTISQHRFNKFVHNPYILFSSNIIGPPSVLMYRRVVSESFDIRLKWIVDWEYYIRLAKNYRLAYINAPLICVSYNSTQITNQVKGNPSVEIPEAMIFYSKYDNNMIQYLLVYDAWWRLIRNLRIRNLDKFKRFYTDKIPPFLIQIIRFQSIIPYFLLKVGLFSKILMFISYMTKKND